MLKASPTPQPSVTNTGQGHPLCELKLKAAYPSTSFCRRTDARSFTLGESGPHRSPPGTIARRFAALLISSTIMAIAGWGAAPALAGWRPSSTTTASIAYNQGITFDQARGTFFFDGVSSTTNSGLYRTNSMLALSAANIAVIPATKEGYNHAGDLSFDPIGRRVLLPLECYYPASGGNTCGVGAISVADPVTLRFLYYVNLDTAQIKKAMWAEISPDGRWIWTSSGTHLLAYPAAKVNRKTADLQRAGTIGGIAGKDLGAVLPTSGVTGATFYQDALTRAPRLLLALNRGTYSEVVSYDTGTAHDGSPTLLSATPRSEITVAQSPSNNESEGLASTGAGNPFNPLGGALHWQMLPVITPSSIYSRILSYLPLPPPPHDGASVQPGQRLGTVLARGLRLTVVCNRRCTTTATATIDGRPARSLELVSPKANTRPYEVGTGSLWAGAGSRTLTISFRSRTRRALGSLPSLTLAITVRSSDAYSQRRSIYRLSIKLKR